MKVLQICESYFKEYGEKLLNENFSDLLPYLCVGVCGSGSENFGYDDEISLDHDVEAGFTIFLPSEDLVDSKKAFALERAYAKLPKEYMGLKRSILSPVGGNRLGVVRIADFMQNKTGSVDGDLTAYDFLRIPEFYLAEVTNGKIFFDSLGKMTEIRKKLAYMPENARLKKLAGNLLVASQSGRYNYERCLKHGEKAGAQLALGQFVNSVIKVIFLLNKKYLPFYKWQFRALRGLEILPQLSDALEFLISSDNESENASVKKAVIEDICSLISKELQRQNITKNTCSDLEKHAYSVNDFITDGDMRNLNILFATD